ncbi:MAG: hypothetical protein AB7T31_10125 [Gemmatimonadales bacterium]
MIRIMKALGGAGASRALLLAVGAYGAVLLSWGCDGGAPIAVPADPTPATAIDSVIVEPSSVVASQIGERVDFSAFPVDGEGNVVNEGAVAWSSSNLGVATVTQTGEARVFGEGTTEIRASVGTETGVAVLTVVPELDPNVPRP